MDSQNQTNPRSISPFEASKAATNNLSTPDHKAGIRRYSFAAGQSPFGSSPSKGRGRRGSITMGPSSGKTRPFGPRRTSVNIEGKLTEQMARSGRIGNDVDGETRRRKGGRRSEYRRMSLVNAAGRGAGIPWNTPENSPNLVRKTSGDFSDSDPHPLLSRRPSASMGVVLFKAALEGASRGNVTQNRLTSKRGSFDQPVAEVFRRKNSDAHPIGGNVSYIRSASGASINDAKRSGNDSMNSSIDKASTNRKSSPATLNVEPIHQTKSEVVLSGQARASPTKHRGRSEGATPSHIVSKIVSEGKEKMRSEKESSILPHFLPHQWMVKYRLLILMSVLLVVSYGKELGAVVLEASREISFVNTEVIIVADFMIKILSVGCGGGLVWRYWGGGYCGSMGVGYTITKLWLCTTTLSLVVFVFSLFSTSPLLSPSSHLLSFAQQSFLYFAVSSMVVLWKHTLSTVYDSELMGRVWALWGWLSSVIVRNGNRKGEKSTAIDTNTDQKESTNTNISTTPANTNPKAPTLTALTTNAIASHEHRRSTFILVLEWLKGEKVSVVVRKGDNGVRDSGAVEGLERFMLVRRHMYEFSVGVVSEVITHLPVLLYTLLLIRTHTITLILNSNLHVYVPNIPLLHTLSSAGFWEFVSGISGAMVVRFVVEIVLFLLSIPLLLVGTILSIVISSTNHMMLLCEYSVGVVVVGGIEFLFEMCTENLTNFSFVYSVGSLLLYSIQTKNKFNFTLTITSTLFHLSAVFVNMISSGGVDDANTSTNLWVLSVGFIGGYVQTSALTGSASNEIETVQSEAETLKTELRNSKSALISSENQSSKLSHLLDQAEIDVVRMRNKADSQSDFLAKYSELLYQRLILLTQYNGLLEDTDLTSPQKDYLIGSARVTESILQLSEDVELIAKISTGKAVGESRPFNPRALAEEVMSNMAATEEEHSFGQSTMPLAVPGPNGTANPPADTIINRVDFITDIASDIPLWVIGDAGLTRRAIKVLLQNAVKYTDNGQICLKVTVVSHQSSFVSLSFSVQDTGIGVDSLYSQDIYQPFFSTQGRSSEYAVDVSTGTGSGIGLYLCSRIARLLGGSLNHSSTAKGSVFALTLSYTASPMSNTNVIPNLNLALPLGSVTMSEIKAISGLNVVVLMKNSDTEMVLARTLRDLRCQVMVTRTPTDLMKIVDGDHGGVFLVDYHACSTQEGDKPTAEDHMVDTVQKSNTIVTNGLDIVNMVRERVWERVKSSATRSSHMSPGIRRIKAERVRTKSLPSGKMPTVSSLGVSIGGEKGGGGVGSGEGGVGQKGSDHISHRDNHDDLKPDGISVPAISPRPQSHARSSPLNPINTDGGKGTGGRVSPYRSNTLKKKQRMKFSSTMYPATILVVTLKERTKLKIQSPQWGDGILCTPINVVPLIKLLSVLSSGPPTIITPARGSGLGIRSNTGESGLISSPLLREMSPRTRPRSPGTILRTRTMSQPIRHDPLFPTIRVSRPSIPSTNTSLEGLLETDNDFGGGSGGDSVKGKGSSDSDSVIVRGRSVSGSGSSLRSIGGGKGKLIGSQNHVVSMPSLAKIPSTTSNSQSDPAIIDTKLENVKNRPAYKSLDDISLSLPLSKKHARVRSVGWRSTSGSESTQASSYQSPQPKKSYGIKKAMSQLFAVDSSISGSNNPMDISAISPRNVKKDVFVGRRKMRGSDLSDVSEHSLPLVPDSIVEETSKVTSKPRGRRRASLSGQIMRKATAPQKDAVKPCVLIAEDNPINLRILCTVFEKHGYCVSSAENGKTALDLFIAHHTDISLCVMDTDMPLMDGITAIRLIRKYEKQHELRPVSIIALFVTDQKGTVPSEYVAQQGGCHFCTRYFGYCNSNTKPKNKGEECMNAGASAVIAKPVDYRYLMVVAESLVPVSFSNQTFASSSSDRISPSPSPESIILSSDESPIRLVPSMTAPEEQMVQPRILSRDTLLSIDSEGRQESGSDSPTGLEGDRGFGRGSRRTVSKRSDSSGSLKNRRQQSQLEHGENMRVSSKDRRRILSMKARVGRESPLNPATRSHSMNMSVMKGRGHIRSLTMSMAEQKIRSPRRQFVSSGTSSASPTRSVPTASPLPRGTPTIDGEGSGDLVPPKRVTPSISADLMMSPRRGNKP